MGDLAYNLESFNPAFTAVLLKVQSTIGHSDYIARDAALKNLIQPLAGEYGMHNGQEQGAYCIIKYAPSVHQHFLSCPVILAGCLNDTDCQAHTTILCLSHERFKTVIRATSLRKRTLSSGAKLPQYCRFTDGIFNVQQ